MPKSGNILQLDVFIENEGLMLVYGRLKNSSMDSSLKHLVLLSMKNQVIDMIKISSHKKVDHGGRGYTINFPRNSGFWMINANSAC